MQLTHAEMEIRTLAVLAIHEAQTFLGEGAESYLVIDHALWLCQFRRNTDEYDLFEAFVEHIIGD